MQTHETSGDHTPAPSYSAHDALVKLGRRVWNRRTGLMGYVVTVDLPLSYHLRGDLTAPTRTVTVEEPLLTIAWDPPRTGRVAPTSWTWEEYQRHAHEL